MEMTWNNCFSPKRFGMQKGQDDIRTQYERDWDRIIFSSPFRRLQNKTQVFPLPEEVFVHNRLTHSLEVSSVGRSLGKIIGKKISELPQVKSDENARPFYRNSLKNVLSSACLAHDLGNPAFGHSGEEAISKYFKKRDTKKPEDIEFKAMFSDAEWQDLITFEGNANALRVLTMQQHDRNKGGFRLTYSTIGSILKYPCESLASDKKILHRKKYGYFKIDEEVFLDIANELNMIPDDIASRIAYKRHPFVYLVEAADDISYNIIDFEDAHRLGILSYEEVSSAFLEIISHNPKDNIEWVTEQAEILKGDPNESIAYLRAKSINALIHKCADVFWDKKEDILKGIYQKSLIEDIPELQSVMQRIEKKSIEKIYNARKVVELEIAGFRIMSGLVEDFVFSALTPENIRDKEQKKILQLLPKQFSFDESSTPYVKVMHIIDFISGMTDVYALKLYRNLRGIEI
ncbi:dGTP triphosphohydrolase [Flavobacterium sp. RSP15]|uniref:dGTP triphosphohydrolase n=1 Tax=Flavobacterium sp. RSP15 TaxID=2497485 RepID=UPI000F81CD6A|nr:dNTP triphosphohydrolase [Flavobacterium sp. RSP15]RTY87400.1 dNTP triphosphohydrolase [Flavobacterium sp. RSP15]